MRISFPLGNVRKIKYFRLNPIFMSSVLVRGVLNKSDFLNRGFEFAICIAYGYGNEFFRRQILMSVEE